MGPIMLLALLSSAIILASFEDGDIDETENFDDDVPIPGPPDLPFYTYGYDEATDTVTIDVSENDPRSLAVFTYVDSQDDEENFFNVYEARYYLVPEDVDLDVTDWETAGNIPGASDFAGGGGYDLAAMEQQLGLELLGVVDLGTENVTDEFPIEGGVADDLPTLQSNVPADIYYVEATTDGDELVTFLPEDFVVTFNGATQTSATANTTGTAGVDWIVAEADGITIDGADGNDLLETAAANVTLDGGAGADDIRSDGQNVTALGGSGNDDIFISTGTALGQDGNDGLFGTEATLSGGNGADTIQSFGPGSVVNGDAGNDNVSASGAGASASGGEGDDFVGARDGALGFGGAGDDRLQVDGGAQGDGGAGNDTLEVWDFHMNQDGAATLTGGAGADTFEALVRNPANGEAGDVYMQITDFDPDEDVLQVGTFNSGGLGVDSIEIVETATYSDVRITFEPNAGLPAGIAVVRLDGVTGLSAGSIVLAT